MISARDRFWSKVRKTPTCWLYEAGLDEDGYGQFWFEGKTVKAHRWAWEDENGPVPEGMQLDHVKERGCIHRNCVRPSHLEPVTCAVNLGRGHHFHSERTQCLKGHPLDGIVHRKHKPDVAYRYCKICNKEREQARRDKRKAAA